jgi:hypothetical protein
MMLWFDSTRKAGAAHLKDVKRLELDVLALVPEQVHHHLEVVLLRNVPRHDVVVGAVEQDLAQQLEGLPLGDVVGRLEKLVVGRKKLWSVSL